MMAMVFCRPVVPCQSYPSLLPLTHASTHPSTQLVEFRRSTPADPTSPSTCNPCEAIHYRIPSLSTTGKMKPTE